MIVRFNNTKNELNEIFTSYSCGGETDIFNTIFTDYNITVCGVSHAKRTLEEYWLHLSVLNSIVV